MKKLLAFITSKFTIFCFIAFYLSFFTFCPAQTSPVDSLKNKLETIKEDSSKFNTLLALSYYYREKKQDSFLLYTKQALGVAIRANKVKEQVLAYVMLGHYEYIVGNYPLALQVLFKSLQLAETINDSNRLATVHLHIGIAYKEYNSPEKAKQQFLQTKIITERLKFEKGMMYSYMNLGEVYYSLNNLDSAMYYAQQAYSLALKLHLISSDVIMLTLANVNSRLNNNSVALAYYKSAIDDDKKEGDLRYLSKSYMGLADFYNKISLKDSAIYFGKQSFIVSKKAPYLEGISNASKFLSAMYDSVHQQDSSYHYLKIFASANDSLNNRNRTAEAENITFLEQMRQQEKEQALEKSKQEKELALEKSKEERKTNIQYALITLGIITFIILFLLLSRKIITNEKIIEFLGVIALLLVFEFLNLLLHPYLEKYTHSTPLLMLLALVFISALLIPLHHRLEKWATTRLVEKNKQIRLAAAKKTIEKLENPKTN